MMILWYDYRLINLWSCDIIKGWTADDIAVREHQEEVREILAEYICGNSAELDPRMIMDTGSRKKDAKDTIPAPIIYGGPACNEEG